MSLYQLCRDSAFIVIISGKRGCDVLPTVCLCVWHEATGRAGNNTSDV